MRAAREVGVHREPVEGSERLTSLTIGEEVFVVEEQGAWTKVLAPDEPMPDERWATLLGAGRLPR